MDIRIDKRRKVPLYRQIMNQIMSLVNENKLLKGDKLPSERVLATQLNVNRSTIVRAYDELYAQGFVERRPNSGTFILGESSDSFSGNPFFVRKKKTEKDPYVLDLEKMIKQNNTRLINAYTGELPYELIPNISLPSFHWKEFLQEDVSTLGYLPLRKTIQSLMSNMYDYHPKEEEVMLTAGGQQSLVLLMQALLKPGDVVAIEDPSFFYGMSLFESMAIKVVKIPVDQNGLSVDALEEVLQVESIQLLLTNPNFQNPTGSSMSLERRKQLVKVCRKYRIPIVEDDVFGQLSYQVPNPLPLLKKLAPETVIYLGSVSKMLGKRMQLGWIDAPKLVLDEVIKVRDEYESELSVFPQVLATHVLQDRTFNNQLNDLRNHLKENSRYLAKELKSQLGTKVTYHLPKGGYYAWLTYSEQVLTRKDWEQFLDNQVAVYPSFLNTENAQSCRLNLARLSKEQLSFFVGRLKLILESIEKDKQVD
ncbi:aminotransferase-like domain-containing protein [Vagococcus carniphilus]|uniref:HTH gntR-type domain-containing protein n=1 Tax=Vagococcus carniphilus TaxID=218144 RepID=A0A430B889_9ENTE|nr:PLP-dependent aminotransferase family protein [Vagococcus carniphilus]QNN74139.1 PLP-dependent aminotransferase family protein [Vagococcus carniphilus]RSU16554.1 hypothetical protein CBF28_03230 [Vagococcus carniphilus]